MNPTPITLQISLLLDEQGNLTAAPPQPEGEDVTVDAAAIKASAHGCVKRSAGEVLSRRIKDAMEDHRLSVAAVAEKVGIGRNTLYAYLAAPGNAPLAILLKICRTVGLRNVTLDTGGTYK